MLCEHSIKYLYNNSEMEDVEIKLEDLHHSIEIKEEYDPVLDIDRIIVSERDVTVSILEQYKDFPCLWDPSMKEYSNRDARNAAYQIILEKLKILEKDANIATLKKKLENMRASYKREWKKVQDSKRTGVGADDIYVPTLWYYEYLTFLDEKDTLRRKGIDTIVNCDEDKVSETHHTDRNISEQRSVKRRSTSGDSRKKQEKLIDCAPSLLSHTEESSAESYGRAIGHQLKEMSNIQRCIAEKMISEVIFYGKLEKLSLQSSISLNSSACNDPSSSPSPYSPLDYHSYSPGSLHSPTYSSPPPVSNSISISTTINPSLQHYTSNAPVHPSFSMQRLGHPFVPPNTQSQLHTLQRNDVTTIGSKNATLKHPHHASANTPSHTNSFQSNHDLHHNNVLREYLIRKKN